MKLVALVAFVFFVSQVSGQTVRLLPDSCTFCMFLSSTGGNSYDQNWYQINPERDTSIQATSYLQIASPFSDIQPIAIRQEGNRVVGIVSGQTSEVLILDFETSVGDTIHNLYSEGHFYDAVVLSNDSIALPSGSYHHFRQLRATRIFHLNEWQDANWGITWNEKSLCGWNIGAENLDQLGGILFNIPSYYYVISIPYAYPTFCTTDTLYTNSEDVSCVDCVVQTNSTTDLWKEKIHLFPNPADDAVRIRFPSAQLRSFAILGLDGKHVHSFQSSEQLIDVDLRFLPPGYYFVQIQYDQHFIMQQFVKR